MVDVAATRVAAVQMTSAPDIETNLSEADRLIHEAVRKGARLVVLPENFGCMPMRDADRLEVAESLGRGPMQEFLSDRARCHGIWLVGGTVPVHSRESRPVSACLVYDDRGQLAGRYDKIHLFDVDIPDKSEHYRESDQTAPGERVVTVDTPIGRVGLAVCYDLRFPELFRRLMQRGADLICVPSAFTVPTGRAHWETLVRARAIENLCFVIASAQTGQHPNGRQTYGDSMIVDFWGLILDRLPEGAGVVVAEIDRERQGRVRARFPALSHCRLPELAE